MLPCRYRREILSSCHHSVGIFSLLPLSNGVPPPTGQPGRSDAPLGEDSEESGGARRAARKQKDRHGAGGINRPSMWGSGYTHHLAQHAGVGGVVDHDSAAVNSSRRQNRIATAGRHSFHSYMPALSVGRYSITRLPRCPGGYRGNGEASGCSADLAHIVRLACDHAATGTSPRPMPACRMMSEVIELRPLLYLYLEAKPGRPCRMAALILERRGEPRAI